MTVSRSGPGRRETSCPPVTPYGAQDSVGHPSRESGGASREHTSVRVHAARLGGRNRSDASRVFHTGRSQGLVVLRRALARKKSVAPPDAGRGRAEGEPVRVWRISNQLSFARPAGLKACRFSIRWKAFSGSRPSCFHRQTERGPSALRSTPARPVARQGSLASTSGGSDSDSGVPVGDEENVRGRHVPGEGSSRTEKVRGESASSALKRRRSQRCAAS
jgi:hypothetical protein